MPERKKEISKKGVAPASINTIGDIVWEAVTPGDQEGINAIGNAVHLSLPERAEVFGEKIALFPEGCRKLVFSGTLVGYGISHPWMLRKIPPLDSFLRRLPEKPECIYIHDVVVAPVARGKNAARQYVDYIKSVAKRHGIGALALVSVYGTDVLWSRYGFESIQDPKLAPKLASYGETAKYMVCVLDAGYASSP